MTFALDGAKSERGGPIHLHYTLANNAEVLGKHTAYLVIIILAGVERKKKATVEKKMYHYFRP